MPDWKDELKAEIESVRDRLIPPIADPFVYMKDNKEKAILELCALILELIDHIPEERTTVPFLGQEPPPEKPQ